MVKKIVRPSQQEFLHMAMEELQLSRAEFSKRISVPMRTLEKWLASDSSKDKRNMSEMAWTFISEILVSKKLEKNKKEIK